MFKNRRLRWHYRSRHESLIAFSNQHFYDSNLILFPSPFKESDEFGIRFTRVEKGCTSSGRNVEEAKMLVDFTAQQLIEHPDESVGIVAMNAKQSEEIEQQLELLLKENPIFQKAYERNQAQADPLFIKNLENVQGDERDVIIISMTYGAETAGMASMHQRFGPINSDVGWRRLNVLFTRSKKRMHVYSSMDSSHIRTDATSKRGVLSLKAFLAYCETKNLHSHHHTGRPADSDFEIAVMDALAKHGYECEPQLGVSGYRLDLAVRDPGRPGRFLIGVECDGATYHSAKSSRDRDRLRQDILESLGWCIHRIWSTDWFKNPQAQLQPILMELEKRRTPVIAAKTIRTTLEDDQLELMY
jgi:very-short-patch-repair endonuclease